MPMFATIEYAEASAEVRRVYDDIMQTRRTDVVSVYWKTLANNPTLLQETWSQFKRVMLEDGALDPMTRELIYLAVSITNRCDYCVSAHTRTARALGMSDAVHAELMSIVSLANGANQMAIGYQIRPADAAEPRTAARSNSAARGPTS